MERFFCFGKKDFCDSELCSLTCEFCDDSGGLEWNQLEIVFESIFGEGYDLSRLRELVQADKDEKYTILPCKIGETLWCINSYGEVEETVAVGFLIENELVLICYREKMFLKYYNAPIGKVLFLTREAAEEALKGES